MAKSVICVLGLVLALVGAGAAHAADELEILESMLKQRQAGKLAEWLDKGVIDIGAADADLARRACALLEKYARVNTLSNDGDGSTSELIEWFEQATDKLLEKAPTKPSAHRAKAHVLGARVNCELAAVRFKGPGPWEQCAELCLKAAELSKTRKARYIADAAKYYGAWYPHAGDRQDEVQAKALATLEEGLAADPDNAYLKAALGEIYLNEAKAAVAIKKKGPAKKALQAALDALLPNGNLPAGGKGTEQAGAYNRVLAYALSNGLRVKGDFITSEKKSAEWILTYPRGTGWKYKVSGSMDGVFYLERDTDWGRCRVLLSQYSWEIAYDSGAVGGDNATGMSELGARQMLGLFSRLDKHKKKIKGKLNRKIKKTAGYDLRGLDEDDEPLRVRGWYFKGNEHRKTYALDVMWWGDAPEDDAEVEYILDHLEERERK